jgi:diacylglycerol O-acyltransferase
MVDKGDVPKKSLIASIPMSVRQLNRTGNQITYITADLATNETDCLKRLKKIGESTSIAKDEVSEISMDAATKFAVVAQGFVALSNQLNLTSLMQSPSNVAISNMPGPRQKLYFGEAELESTYPLSILIDGQSLNITVVSYCDNIGFGFMACRDTIPDVQKLADYIEESLDTLKARLSLKKQINF